MADLPFRAEYAKSGRAACKQCKSNIMKDELRLAAMVQSPMFDGKVPHWYHFRCFFGKFKVKSAGDVEHLESLRWDDQTKIKDKVVGGGAAGSDAPTPSSSNGKATKRKSSKKSAAGSSELDEFACEYAKSNRSGCKYCDIKINKGDVRISKKDYESPEALRFGSIPRWFHVDCFVKAREGLEFFESADMLPGFGTLGVEDQKSLKSKLKKIERKVIKTEGDVVDGPPDPKKVKVDQSEQKKLKVQNDLIFGYIDKLKKSELNKKELTAFLEYNDQGIPSGESRIMERIADIMAFGAIVPCPECKEGQLAYNNTEYKCTGNMTEWTKCQYVTKIPERRPFLVPEEFKEAHDFLKTYKYKKRERIFPKVQAARTVPKALPSAANIKSRPLENAKIVLLGKLQASKEELTKKIEELGGKVTSRLDSKTACVISTPAEVMKQSKRIKDAEKHGIHIVSENFLSSVEKGGAAIMIVQHSIATWGGKPEDRLDGAMLERKSKSEVAFGRKQSTMKMTVKGASAVDPDSGLERQAHVLEKDGSPYNAVLGMVDISRGTNSFYKLQILEADNGNKYWVFRAWGRVGTTIGGKKLENMDSKMDALQQFKFLYEEKTGNPWDLRESSDKQPGRFYPLDIDYGQNEEKVQKLTPGIKSELPKSVQELICLIFDVESMKKAMVEFEIDLKKMPLGKLSKRQMEKAYSVLTEVQELIKSGGSETKFLDASNRFYTLIPHDFGLKSPPLLNNEELIKSKIEMLDSLMEIEVAYNLLLDTDNKSEVDPVDQHYKQLKTELVEMDKKSDEFDLLKKYVKNTHAATHSGYSLDVEEIFKVKREGEEKKYKPFKQLNNRHLLWHGSRITNYAGILSQGLRIAPPEAPVTGYMFGKGVYFADMVSKSANYCFTSRANPTGLLLLCEVALGNMYELKNAKMITSLPANKHSTKGIGSTYPDPKQQIVTPEGVVIPLGTAQTQPTYSSLLYNEYIVYDTAQIQIKYLLKTKFNYKY